MRDQDPSWLLRRVREAVVDYVRMRTFPPRPEQLDLLVHLADQMGSNFTELDRFLSDGGELPRDWEGQS